MLAQHRREIARRIILCRAAGKLVSATYVATQMGLTASLEDVIMIKNLIKTARVEVYISLEGRRP